MTNSDYLLKAAIKKVTEKLNEIKNINKQIDLFNKKINNQIK